MRIRLLSNLLTASYPKRGKPAAQPDSRLSARHARRWWRKTQKVTLAAVLATLLSYGGIAGDTVAAPQKEKAPNQKLEPCECGDVARIHTMNGFFLASQPNPKDFQEAKKGGIERVTTLRHPDEADVDEEGIVPDTSGSYDEPIGLAVRQGVKVVYQIKTDTWKKDVAGGLHYLDKLARVYSELGIRPGDREIVGVFHGDAGYFLLKDSAFRKAAENRGKNPNRQIVREVLDAGVRLELCKSTMRSHGWTGEDVLPGVKIVVGAYPRIIDLQLRGYAYIRF